MQIIDVEAASELVDHSITVGGVCEANEVEHHDLSEIEKKIDSFKARKSTNKPDDVNHLRQMLASMTTNDIKSSRTKVEADIALNNNINC